MKTDSLRDARNIVITVRALSNDDGHNIIIRCTVNNIYRRVSNISAPK